MSNPPVLPRMDLPQMESVVSDVPTDVEHPVLYERTVLLLGIVAVLAVLGLIGLAVLGKTISEGLVAIGASAVGGLVTLLAPRQK